MLLRPIRLRNAAELENFIKGLKDKEIIHLEFADNREKITAASLPKLKQYIITSTNGDSYFLEDVRDYLYSSIRNSQNDQIEFYISEYKFVTLAQIKADLTLLNHLQTTLFADPTDFLFSINPTLFVDPISFPELKTFNDIEKMHTIFNNESFYLTIRNQMLLTKKFINQIPLHCSFSQFQQFKLRKIIPYLNKDIIKIALQQELLIKSYLLKKITQYTNENEIQFINEWIKRIDDNNAVVTKLFQQIITGIKDIRSKNREAILIHKHIINTDPTLEKTKEKILALNEQLIKNEKSLARLRGAFNILKPVVAYGAILLLMIPSVVIVAMASIYFLGGGIIIALTAAFLASILIFGPQVLLFNYSNLVRNKIWKIKNSIETKFDSILDDANLKCKKSRDKIEQQCFDLQHAINLAENLNELLQPEDNAKSCELLLFELEKDLKEITDFGGATKSTKFSANMSHSVCDIGIFKENNEDTSMLPELKYRYSP